MRSDRRVHQPFDNRGEQHRPYKQVRRPRVTPFRVMVSILVVVALATLWHTQSKCDSIIGANSALCAD